MDCYDHIVRDPAITNAAKRAARTGGERAC